MLFFYDKLFFIGLVALPLLMVIYFLFKRSQPKMVSSLLLWEDQFKSRQSGLRIKNLPLPLTFLLELLALLMLVLAAAMPLLPRDSAGTVNVILDNSYSMLAGSPSAKEKVMRKVKSVLNEFSGRHFRIILAGPSPRNLGLFKDAAHANAALSRWKCTAPEAALDNAIAFTRKIGKKHDLNYVFTDTMTKSNLPENFVWQAYGENLPNTAIVNAVRSTDDNDRCLVIVANMSDQPASNDIIMSYTKKGKLRKIGKHVLLAPDELKKFTLPVPCGVGKVEVRLGNDSLETDNLAVLLPEKHKSLRTAVVMKDAKLKKIIVDALKVTGKIVIGAPRPQLYITDTPGASHYFTKLTFYDQGKAKSVTGPFTINRRHPLTQGLNLKGILWGISGKASMRGIPLVMSGKRTLLSVAKHPDNTAEVCFDLAPSHSTLQNTPDWPVFFWNLTDWTTSRLPGLKRKNYRLGEKISFNLPENIKKIQVISPDGEITGNRVPNNQFICNPGTAGKYAFKGEGFNDEIQVNPLNFEESDLRKLASGSKNGAMQDAGIRKNFIDIGWIFLLIAAGLLTLDWFMIRKRSDA